ncbi:MAG: hypothetical protein AMXMBFR47_07340 [Planctomycetota bacterium]
MDGPRLTEERLRFHLDSNQVMRERLCLAIMPLLGPYTQVRPRRPKGGPDGGRDIEALSHGSTAVWGAVGFRNGGGNDDAARRETRDKFDADLSRALSESPDLREFVFFTNVDLTPGIIEQLKRAAASRGLAAVDICDMERLRHALDSPEGLIARLQFLDIPMSPTEQIGLVSKFGSQLQQAVISRFDRVERTLSEMERFLDLQKPLHRLDVYLSLKEPCCSADIGDEAVLLQIDGLHHIGKSTYCLCVNHTGHKESSNAVVLWPHSWLESKPDKIVSFLPSLGQTRTLGAAYCALTITTLGQRLKVADLTVVFLTVYATPGILPIVDRVLVDLNGYELFNCPVSGIATNIPVEIPTSIPIAPKAWDIVVKNAERDVWFDALVRSGRHHRLKRNVGAGDKAGS